MLFLTCLQVQLAEFQCSLGYTGVVHITHTVLESQPLLEYGPPLIFGKWTTIFYCRNWWKNLKGTMYVRKNVKRILEKKSQI